MDIQELIFETVSNHPQLWIKYFKLTEYKAMSSPGEYLTIRASFIGSETINRILAEGFVIETIQSKKIDADTYSDVHLKRELNFKKD